MGTNPIIPQTPVIPVTAEPKVTRKRWFTRVLHGVVVGGLAIATANPAILPEKSIPYVALGLSLLQGVIGERQASSTPDGRKIIQ